MSLRTTMEWSLITLLLEEELEDCEDKNAFTYLFDNHIIYSLLAMRFGEERLDEKREVVWEKWQEWKLSGRI